MALAKPDYRVCERCGYNMLSQLKGCPNCHGLSDEEVSQLAESKNSEHGDAQPNNQPGKSVADLPDLGIRFFIYALMACAAIAAVFLLFYLGKV